MKFFFIFIYFAMFAENQDNKKEKYLFLDEKWKTKINFTSKENVMQMLKEIARELDLRLNLQISEEKIQIQYEAENKEFWLIIIDICQLLDLKVFFKNKNATVSKDSIYSKNYIVQSLSSKRNMQGKTKLENTNNVTTEGQIDYQSNTDFFEELTQNLENLRLQHPEMNYFINKQSGILNIVGTQKIHKLITIYLDQIIQNCNKQILIEAKIMEVTLSNEFEQGINWDMISVNGIIKKFISAAGGESIFFIKNSTSEDGNILNLIKCLEKFGSIKTISNPRLSITHNKPGIFKAIENKSYFTIKQDSLEIINKKNSSFKPIMNSQIHTMQIGVTLLIDLISIDKDHTTVMLKLTISDMTGYKIDPVTYKITNSKELSQIPQTGIRELDTIITLKNNEVICIGGSRSVNETKQEHSNFFLKILGGKESKKETKEIVITLETTNITQKIDCFNSLNIYQE